VHPELGAPLSESWDCCRAARLTLGDALGTVLSDALGRSGDARSSTGRGARGRH
jgi:hypothetical protein